MQGTQALFLGGGAFFIYKQEAHEQSVAGHRHSHQPWPTPVYIAGPPSQDVVTEVQKVDQTMQAGLRDRVLVACSGLMANSQTGAFRSLYVYPFSIHIEQLPSAAVDRGTESNVLLDKAEQQQTCLSSYHAASSQNKFYIRSSFPLQFPPCTLYGTAAPEVGCFTCKGAYNTNTWQNHLFCNHPNMKPTLTFYNFVNEHKIRTQPLLSQQEPFPPPQKKKKKKWEKKHLWKRDTRDPYLWGSTFKLVRTEPLFWY